MFHCSEVWGSPLVLLRMSPTAQHVTISLKRSFSGMSHLIWGDKSYESLPGLEIIFRFCCWNSCCWLSADLSRFPSLPALISLSPTISILERSPAGSFRDCFDGFTRRDEIISRCDKDVPSSRSWDLLTFFVFGSLKLFSDLGELHGACREVFRKKRAQLKHVLSEQVRVQPSLLSLSNSSTLSTNAPSGSELRNQSPCTLS